MRVEDDEGKKSNLRCSSVNNLNNIIIQRIV